MPTSNKYVVNVPVATLWTKPESARDIDKEATTKPLNIEAWLTKMDYDNRLDLCEANRVQSQVLFGQAVQVLEESGVWAKVVVPEQPSKKDERGYPGWIPVCQLTPDADWDLANGPVAVVNSGKAILYSSGREPVMELSYQTILPLQEKGSEYITVKTPDGIGLLKAEDVSMRTGIDNRRKGNGQDIVEAGKQFLGLPYLWGGMSSYGYDCSGFSYSVCRANGYTIPRDAHEQADAGAEIELDKIQPGDLLFFAYEDGKGSIHHVGIYYGDGKLLHSPKTGKTVEIIDLEGTIYEKELCAASRYWQETEE
ncbi:NlpC/P60 family protein [Peribacillus sp. SCS-155]|uniref:C40 family peptidase n=1 Tax=Peribacillus sedimenti TaxID=3115297 RepID=UPI0039060DC8